MVMPVQRRGKKTDRKFKVQCVGLVIGSSTSGFLSFHCVEYQLAFSFGWCLLRWQETLNFVSSSMSNKRVWLLASVVPSICIRMQYWSNLIQNSVSVVSDTNLSLFCFPLPKIAPKANCALPIGYLLPQRHTVHYMCVVYVHSFSPLVH